MEASSELQMKLRQRRARMGEETSLVDIVNTLPEQEPSKTARANQTDLDVFSSDVKVKQRCSMFEGVENRNSNSQSGQNGKNPTNAQQLCKLGEPPQRPTAPPLRCTSPVKPPLHSASPPLRSVSPRLRNGSPATGRIRPMMSFEQGEPASQTPMVQSAEPGVLEDQMADPASKMPMAKRAEPGHMPANGEAASALFSEQFERAGAKPEDALPAPGPEAGRKAMEAIDEEEASEEEELLSSSCNIEDPSLSARALLAMGSAPALPAGVAEAFAASDPDAIAAFFCILDDSLDLADGQALGRSRRSCASSVASTSSPSGDTSAVEPKDSSKGSMASQEKRTSSPSSRQGEEGYEPMEYVVLDYFHSLPTEFVQKLRQNIEGHVEEVRHLRKENRHLRKMCNSPSPPSSPSKVRGAEAAEVQGSVGQVVGAAEAPVTEVARALVEQAEVPAAESQPCEAPEEPVTVWMPRALPEAAAITKPWPIQKQLPFSVAAPAGPPAGSSPLVFTHPPAPSPPTPAPVANIAMMARQVMANSAHAVSPQPPASPSHRPGPPRRPTTALTPGSRATTVVTPSSSPARRTTAPTPGSRGSAGTPPQLPTWRAAPLVSAMPRMLAFEASQTPCVQPPDPMGIGKQRARDERAEVSGAQALISQLSDAISKAHGKMQKQDAERWALVNEAMRELAQLPELGRPADQCASTPDRTRRAPSLRAVTASAQAVSSGRRAAGGLRSASADARRQPGSPLPTRRRVAELTPSRQREGASDMGKAALAGSPRCTVRTRSGQTRRGPAGWSP